MVRRRKFLVGGTVAISGVSLSGCTSFFENEIYLSVRNSDLHNERSYFIELFEIDQEKQAEEKFQEISFEIDRFSDKRTTIEKIPDMIRVAVDDYDSMDLKYNPAPQHQCEEVSELEVRTTFSDSGYDAHIVHSCRD